MERYARIESVTFDNIPLALPLSLRLLRQCQPLPAASDGDAFTSNIQLSLPTITVELRVRGTKSAESLSLGRAGTLQAVLSPSCSGQPVRRITLDGAVLHSIELDYAQAAFATAALKFTLAAPDPTTDPFAAEDLP